MKPKFSVHKQSDRARGNREAQDAEKRRENGAVKLPGYGRAVEDKKHAEGAPRYGVGRVGIGRGYQPAEYEGRANLPEAFPHPQREEQLPPEWINQGLDRELPHRFSPPQGGRVFRPRRPSATLRRRKKRQEHIQPRKSFEPLGYGGIKKPALRSPGKLSRSQKQQEPAVFSNPRSTLTEKTVSSSITLLRAETMFQTSDILELMDYLLDLEESAEGEKRERAKPPAAKYAAKGDPFSGWWDKGERATPPVTDHASTGDPLDNHVKQLREQKNKEEQDKNDELYEKIQFYLQRIKREQNNRFHTRDGKLIDSQLYNYAHLNRRTLKKLIDPNKARYARVEKRTLLCLCVALCLSPNEAKELLALRNFEFDTIDKLKRAEKSNDNESEKGKIVNDRFTQDELIWCCLDNRVFDVEEVHTFLIEQKEKYHLTFDCIFDESDDTYAKMR